MAGRPGCACRCTELDRLFLRGAMSARRAPILLMGPTGAGKSDLALQLAEALPLEIVSVDSALVYRGMDIGTAKPQRRHARAGGAPLDRHSRSRGELFGRRIHARRRRQPMQEIWRRGRQPLLVGGTMLYFHALTHGIARLPAGGCRGARGHRMRRRQASGWAALAPGTRAGGSGGRGAHPCQRPAAHSARAGGLPADRRDHHRPATDARVGVRRRAGDGNCARAP